MSNRFDDETRAENVTERKEPFDKPKLTYVKPEVVEHAIADVTAGFFGTFYP